MADYYPLIAQAVIGLDNGQDRRRLYERGQNAIVTELRAVRPPLSESVIARERLAFEKRSARWRPKRPAAPTNRTNLQLVASA